MAYTLDYRGSPNQTYDEARAAPTGIIIHHWGQDGQTHDGVVSWLTNREAGTSAHYVASAGRVTCLVDPIDSAWHAGNWPSNYANVGIECRPEMSADDFETVAEVVAWLWKRFSRIPLSGHRDHVQTACPGRWYPQLGALAARAEEILSGAPTTTAKSAHARINEGESMYLIRCTTPWGAYAYAKINIAGLGGAEAVSQAEADLWYRLLGDVRKVSWDDWNTLVERAWQAHNQALEAFTGAVAVEVEAAVQKVVDDAKALATPKGE